MSNAVEEHRVTSVHTVNGRVSIYLAGRNQVIVTDRFHLAGPHGSPQAKGLGSDVQSVGLEVAARILGYKGRPLQANFVGRVTSARFTEAGACVLNISMTRMALRKVLLSNERRFNPAAVDRAMLQLGGKGSREVEIVLPPRTYERGSWLTMMSARSVAAAKM